MSILSERELPSYTLGEELSNSISHGAGALLSVAALVLCLIQAAKNGSAMHLISAAVYGVSLILLYSMSSIYHALGRNAGKKVLRVIDHCSIFLLIAGSYTPLTLITLHSANPVWGWVIFGVVWAAAIVGIVLNAISLERFKVFSMICYLAMGWAIILAFKPLMSVFTGPGLSLLLWGGIAYTIGAVAYGIGPKVKYMHGVFHLFVLCGSVLHFFCIYLYVL